MGLLEPDERHRVDNLAGWALDVAVYRDEDTLLPGRRPVVMIPGYAMNTFILAYHPRGMSMVEYLVSRGFEVWTANLRGQGGSTPLGRPATYGMAELALDDLPRVWEHVLATTRTGADRLDAVGCSLGGSLVYGYLAHHPGDHPFGSVVAIGGPLRWEAVHPLLKVAFASGRLVGAVPIKGTRTLARLGLPILTRVPALLDLYMNHEQIDLSAADQLVNTVDDPVPYVNRQLARWVRRKDLWMRGVDVTASLRGVTDVQVLAVLANRDGIVPPAAAASIREVLGTSAVDILDVGTDDRWYAHADLFIGNAAETEVFAPLADWLVGRQSD